MFSRYRKNPSLELRDQLLESNLKLVVSIAKNYRNQGIDFMDLIQTGNLGLLKAIDRFDFSLGFKFSTYASWWIRQSITRSIGNRADMIRIPIHTKDAIRKMHKVNHELFQELGRNPTSSEIAEKMNVSIERVEQYKKFDLDIVSFEIPVGEEQDTTLGEMIADENSVSLQEAVEEAEAPRVLLNAFFHARLTEREMEILSLRYGVVDGECRTLEEIGSVYHITRERVRQIEEKTLGKLEKDRSLKSYYLDTEAPVFLVNSMMPSELEIQTRYDSMISHIHSLLEQMVLDTETCAFAHKPLQKK